jgi:uncharacterized protein YjiS (DUF1127 family)
LSGTNEHFRLIAGVGLRHILFRIRSNLPSLLKESLRRISTRRQLAAFDDTALRDLGITRSDAACEAAKPFWRA